LDTAKGSRRGCCACCIKRLMACLRQPYDQHCVSRMTMVRRYADQSVNLTLRADGKIKFSKSVDPSVVGFRDPERILD
jgi:hypothetical protein